MLLAVIAWMIAAKTERDMRNVLIYETEIGACGISIEQVKNLTGTQSDLNSADYLHLKKQFATILKINKKLRFVYLMGRKDNGSLFFYADDRPVGNAEEAPAGMLYDDAPEGFYRVFDTGVASIEGPFSDKWGEFVSGCAPLVDPKTGKTIAIFAIDYDAHSWYWDIFSRAVLPVSLLLLLFVAVLLWTLSRNRGKSLRESEEKHRVLFDNSPVAYLILNDGIVIDCNHAAEIMLRGTQEQIIGSTPDKFSPEFQSDGKASQQVATEKIAESLRTGTTSFEWMHRRLDGTDFWGYVSLNEMMLNGKTVLFTTLVDITDRKRGEDALRMSEESYRNQFSNNSAMMLLIDPVEGSIVDANSTAISFYGYTREKLLSMRITDINTLSFEKVHQAMESIKQGAGKRFHFQHMLADGSLREVEVSATLVQFGGRDMLHSIVHDVTERKFAENKLRESEIFQRILLSNLQVGVVIIDPETRIIESANEYVEDLFGAPMDTFVGKRCHSLLCPASEGACPICDLHHIVDNSDRIMLGVDGSRIPIMKTVKTIRLNDKNKLLECFVDITNRKTMENALRESEENFRVFFETIDDMIFISDEKGTIFFSNAAVSRKLGYSPVELNGMHVLDVHPTEKRKEAEEIFGDMFAGKRDFCPLPLMKKDGTTIPVETRIWFGKWNGKDCIFGISKDLSNEQESLQKFNKIFDNNPALMAISSLPGRIITDVNQVFISKTGYSKDEIVGKTASELELFVEPEKQKELAYNLEKNGYVYNYELKIKTKTGELLSGLFSGEIIESQGKKYFLTVMSDITEIKLAHDQLEQVTTRLSLAARAGRIGVWDYDLINNNLVWDERMFELYGISKIDFSGAYEAWQKGLHPDDALRGDVEIQMAIRGEKDFDTEFRVVWPNGTIHIIKALAVIQRDESGKALRMIGTNWDITEQRSSEEIVQNYATQIEIKNLALDRALTVAQDARKKADEMAEQAAVANAAKSDFLANMSHEIRTPLNGVIGFTDLLRKTKLSAIQQQYVDNANTAGISLLGIINDILDFSKIEAGKLELETIRTDLIELIEQATDIIKYHASQKGIELLLHISTGLPRFADVDPVRLRQILVNLLSNAVKFTEIGEVELNVSFVQCSDEKGSFTFSVRDTGIGISEEQQKKLFKAFSQADTSTTRKYGGTGLGLIISNLLAEKMGGKIELISEPGKGTTFFFTIETSYELGEKLDPACLTDVHRVLVIDDNDMNRLVLEHTFNDWGIEFTGCDNGLTALKIIERSQHFDVIIVDYHMPYVNGLDTIKMIREQLHLSPEIQPIMLLHSSSDDAGIHEACKMLGVRFNLIKPVKSQELLHYLKNIHSKSTETKNKYSDDLGSGQQSMPLGETPVILIAEDVPMNMLLVTTIVKQIIPNAKIVEAKNGYEAVEMAIAKTPRLVLMDVQMPEMSGLQATEKIREYEINTGEHMPIVALTAGVVKGEEDKCHKAGMDDFLTKPIDQAALRKILEKYVISVQLNSSLPIHSGITKEENPHFDHKKLIRRIDNDRDLFNTFLEIAPEQFSNYISDLQKAINDGKRENVRRSAHALKGAALSMCFPILAELAQVLEKNTESLEADSGVVMTKISAEWEYVLSDIIRIKKPDGSMSI